MNELINNSLPVLVPTIGIVGGILFLIAIGVGIYVIRNSP